MKIQYGLWFALLLPLQIFCQDLVKGRIVDSRTGEGLAFVNIWFNNDPYSVCTSDIDGRFFFKGKSELKQLSCHYLGYHDLQMNLDSFSHRDKLLIKMTVSDIQLQEVTIQSKEDPANPIIRKAIQNRSINNPENLSSFRYLCYNKTVLDFKSSTDSLKTDTLKLRLDSVFKGGHVMMMESVTEGKYNRPGLIQETVLGTKVSGFKYPNFATLATDVQPFSFYKEVLTILDVNYLNPVSAGSLNKYWFHLEDTLFQGKDTVYIISYKPKAGKNFEGLKGSLYINSNHFAIQNVIAEPADKGLIDVKIQQQYALVAQHWFPKQLSFELRILSYPRPELGISMKGRSYLDSVRINPEIPEREFSQTAVQMQENAGKRDSLFWQKYRQENLDEKERITYRVVDSIGREANSDRLIYLIEKISKNRLPIGFLDLELSKTFINNKYEGQRLGLGLYTNERFLKRISLGGFFGYGLRDKAWKYSGGFTWTLNKQKDFELAAFYQNSLAEAGQTGLKVFEPYRFGWRDFIAYRMDKVRQESISAGIRPFKYSRLNISANHTVADPQYDYEFYQDQKQEAIHSYTNAELKLGFRFAYREKLVQAFNQILSEGTDYPVLSVIYSRGLKDIYGSMFEYNKAELRIEQTFFRKNVGQTRFRLEGGYVDQPLPYGLLFTGEGAYDKDLKILLRNYFQTMRPYEFLSDRYVNLFFSHSFGSLLFKARKFKPLISFHQNMGWGTLTHKQDQQLVSFTTKEKGYYESGLIVDNLLKLNYLNIAYLGLGAGVFYRYGPYAYEKPPENLFYKFSFTISTK